MAFAMDRTYSYSSDGSSMGWSTSTTNDVPRTLFYDMSNRLICATSVAGSTTCPTTSAAPFLEAFTYDATDSRLTYRDSTGTTNYTYNGVAMTREDPPGSYDRRQFYALTNGGNRTSDRDQTLANTTRTYTYDALQRLRQVSLSRPVSGSTYATHLITVHDDHRARPYYVTVLNQSTGVEEGNRYYYGLDDELITWIRTPNASVATTYEERQYVYIGDFAVGEMFRSWLSGSATRRTYYHAVEPMGLELAAFEFEHPGGPAVTYNPLTVVQRWSGFGMRTFQSGTGTPLPTRFPGQLELRASDVRLWNGGSTVEFAHALYLNRWRVYDPRVGQYLQPDPMAIEGEGREHGYQYAIAAPADFGDPDGRQCSPSWGRPPPTGCELREPLIIGGSRGCGGGSDIFCNYRCSGGESFRYICQRRGPSGELCPGVGSGGRLPSDEAFDRQYCSEQWRF
jgi:RHS repeat-associated protein